MAGKKKNNQPTEKECHGCHEVKPIDQFVRQVGVANPGNIYCVDCAAQRERQMVAQIKAEQVLGPVELHPSIETDHYMMVRVRRVRTAAKSDEAIERSRRGAWLCGVCAGPNTRCIHYKDESCLAMRKYSLEFLCEDCACYTTWDYLD